MNFLPLELLDIILLKSYLHYALNRDRFKYESDRLLVTRLATVDHCWSERLRKRKFRRILWRRISSEPPPPATILTLLFGSLSASLFLLKTYFYSRGLRTGS